VLGSVTPPGRLRRALDEALARLDPAAAHARLIDLVEARIPLADGRSPQDLGDDTAGVAAALAEGEAAQSATSGTCSRSSARSWSPGGLPRLA
jgi:hypothetical protein